MKIAIVDIGWKEIIGPNPMSGALGGSETWLMQISKEFVNNGIEVDLYCNTKENFQFNGVNFIWDKAFIGTQEKYDFVILNRFFEKYSINYIEMIKTNNIAKHVYIQIHDLSFILEEGLLPINTDVSKYNLCSDFVTIVTLNEWHKNNLIAQYPLLYAMNVDIVCIPNGVDLSLFKEHNFERDNRILWSSCAERGLDILMNDVYPLVKKEIPDFGVDVAGYNDLSGIETKGKDIKVLGRLTKEQLYEEMSKHKVWFYPGTFAETFCVTMLEQFLSGAQIVSPFTYGMRPTIGYADSIKMENMFAEPVYKQAVQEAADKIIEILKGKKAPEIYSDIEKKIHTEYNWKHSVELYLNFFKDGLYERRFIGKTELKKKVLILSMNCNNQYFRGLLGTVKNTWAKPVIQGKYENAIWFGYTSCDRRHPTPMIDWDDHMIYVDCEDDRYSTYEKTQKAYQLIKEADIDFDFILRTNTSNYVNLNVMFDLINNMQENDIYGLKTSWFITDQIRQTSEFSTHFIAGHCFIMSKKYFEIGLSKEKNQLYLPKNSTDDVVMGKNLFDVIDIDTVNILNPNPKKYSDYPIYKPCNLEDYEPGTQKCYYWDMSRGVYDPDLINRCGVIIIRSNYGDLMERSERSHEIEHFYEIDDALG